MSAAKQQELQAFTDEVNRLSRLRCDAINAKGDRLFKAVHTDFPTGMMQFYVREGLTAQQALDCIWVRSE